MDCLVLHGDTVIGRTALDWDMATSESPPDEGPTIFGRMVPTAAYEAIRATCQALRRVMHPDYLHPSPSGTPTDSSKRAAYGSVLMTESLDGSLRRRKAVDAATALGLHLTRPDGKPVTTVRVVIEDFTAMSDETADFTPEYTETESPLIVEATMPPGATPP